MSLEPPSKPTRLCPTCGTRVSEDAIRCLVCGTELATSEKPTRPPKAIQGSRIPEVRLSLPAAIGILALLLALLGAAYYLGRNALSGSAPPLEQVATATPTITLTATVTSSPTPVTPTITHTPEPTATPVVYSVKLGDTCGGIAAAFKVSITSIVLLNNLPADCGILLEGQKLSIPQPTPTPTPQPTSTLNPLQATEAACEKVEHEVKSTDTLSSIAGTYAVPADAIREYNGLVNDFVRLGQKLVIPLCRRNATPGPTPTPTLPPPYPAPNLLLPADGAYFLTDETISLQWASVGTMRENEAYAVMVEDVTEGKGRKLVEYVTDTKFILPSSFRSNDNLPHSYRWWVIPVRQIGTDNDGNPVWDAAGSSSAQRIFSWWVGGGAAPTATPAP